jgi:transcriptional regulator GlxA family with amidase domain
MKSILSRLLEEFHHPGSLGQRHFIRAMLTEALLLFVRKGNEKKQEEDRAATSGSLWAILHFMHTHCEQHLTMEELCRNFGMTAAQLRQSLKKQTGQNFLEYLHRLRVERAATLLRYSQLPITDIAYEVGFESLNTFGRVFRKLKGMSARDFRISAFGE